MRHSHLPMMQKAYLENAEYPIVLKADGLALGKGVLICPTKEEALAGVDELMLDKKFGSAGNTIVIEEFMTGREVSVLSFVDGNTIRIMSSAQDHKRAKDGDQGLNTGGMGNFSPSPFYTKEVDDFCQKYVYQPTVDAMKAEGRPFKGVIFFGLMLTPNGPRVLEYNARFGDPEAQVVLPRMKNDIIDVFEAWHRRNHLIKIEPSVLKTMHAYVLFLLLTDTLFLMKKDLRLQVWINSMMMKDISFSMQEQSLMKRAKL